MVSDDVSQMEVTLLAFSFSDVVTQIRTGILLFLPSADVVQKCPRSTVVLYGKS